MALRLARTSAEAHLYMDMCPCEHCGGVGFDGARSSVIEAEGDLASHYAGTCHRCGNRREFTFRLPQDVIIPGEESMFGDERPSELIDAGMWLWVADRVVTDVPAEPHAGMTAKERQGARQDLLAAAAAVGEARKVVPPGAEAVPAEALWSELGRAVYQAEPGRFWGGRLDAVQRTYRRLAEGFAG